MSARSKKKTKPGQAPLSEALQECFEILKFLQSRPDAEPFRMPVDWELYGLNDYPEIIAQPMDLGTIESKLESGKYKDPTQFYNDVKLVWDNCMKYNRPDSELYQTAERLSKVFEKRFAKLKASPQNNNASSTKQKIKTEDSSSSIKSEASRTDRLKFSTLVNSLSPDQLGHLVEMISNQCPEALNEDEEEEIEIEINNIDGATLSNLIQYCQSCTAESQSKKQKMK